MDIFYIYIPRGLKFLKNRRVLLPNKRLVL